MVEFLNTDLYKWLLLPASIFIARVITETIGTLRIMFLAKDNRVVAPILGFWRYYFGLLL